MNALHKRRSSVGGGGGLKLFTKNKYVTLCDDCVIFKYRDPDETAIKDLHGSFFLLQNLSFFALNFIGKVRYYVERRIGILAR